MSETLKQIDFDAIDDLSEALGAIGELRAALAEAQAEVERLKAAEFWTNFVYPEGAKPEDVQNELIDFKYLMDQATLVYCELTGGRLSKINYPADVVISEACAAQERHTEEAVTEAVNLNSLALQAEIEELQAEIERLKNPWRPIAYAPKSGEINGVPVVFKGPFGYGFGEYLEAQGDGLDSMGHDAGWFITGTDGTAWPGRSFGNPDYQTPPEDQPTHYAPIPAPPERGGEK